MISTDRKKIWLWCLYDFANSLAMTSFSFYFVLWLIDDHQKGDLWVSVPVALSTLLLFFTLPALGGRSDRQGKRMPYLIGFTWISFMTLFLLGILALKINVFTWIPLFLITFLYFLFQYSFQASLGFYHSLINDLTGPTKERISGWGMAANQVGSIVGLIVTYPIAEGLVSFNGISGRSATFLVSSILFLLFCLPVLLFLKDSQKTMASKENNPSNPSIKETLSNLKNIRQAPGVLPYLIAYYCFADAILTLQLFVAIYLEFVAGFTDGEKTLSGVLALLFAIAGALLSGKIAEIFKSTKRAITFLIALFALLIGALALAQSTWNFMIIMMLTGFAYGALFSLSRAYYSHLVPADRQGEFFGLYVLFERFASFLGPLMWSGTIFFFAFLGKVPSYRLAMLFLGILIAIGLIPLRFVKDKA